MRLFIDVDGVLLGKRHARDVRHTLAGGCEAFIEFALERFDCFWLTSHCRGDTQAVLNYLRPYASDSLFERLEQIRPSNYRTFKTEALQGDFLWIDDAPLMYEINVLIENDQLHRWLQVDTRRDFHALEKLQPDLESILLHGFQ